MPRIIDADWYAYPEYYDIAFQADTKNEADFIEAAAAKYCSFPLRRLVEPGCGTGRLVRELAGRGYDVVGIDLVPEAIDFLKRGLVADRRSADVFVADMTDFTLDPPADVAYCFCNTFRHLLDEEAALNHLRSTAKSLRRGGLYLVGLHLLPPDADLEDCERWTETRGDTRVTTTFRVLETDLAGRIEKLRTNLCAHAGEKCVRVRTDYPMRIYDAAQFRSLIASAAEFELCDVYDFWYEIDHPRVLDDEISDTVAILRKR